MYCTRSYKKVYSQVIVASYSSQGEAKGVIASSLIVVFFSYLSHIIAVYS